MTRTAKWAGARTLLKRLRDVMAAGGAAQQRLDRIVRLIAADMVAEVCSLYVMRPGEILELFATQGLKPEAVHRTRLRVGEGIVGHVAATAHSIALRDAPRHPAFVYLPETGEDPYHSMMGVPILRAGRVIGVLAVQNVTARAYTEEEVETLETVSMVVAELLSAGDILDRAEMGTADATVSGPVRTEGVRLSPGIAIGIAVMHRPEVRIERMVAEDSAAELERLREAMDGMRSRLTSLVQEVGEAGDGGGEHMEVLHAYRMIAEDRGWLRRMEEAVESGLTAEGAVQKVQNDTRARMRQVKDAYLRERLVDLEELAFRLLQHLDGSVGAVAGDLPADAILVARTLGPAELLDYDRSKLKGVVLEEGSATSHVAIVAKALELPMVGRVADLLAQVEAGDGVILDAGSGTVFLRPQDDVRAAFQKSLMTSRERREIYRQTRDLPAVTRDGVEVSLLMNAGLLIDMDHLAETGAQGVGLYRTEVPFMVHAEFPDVAAQTALYSRIYEKAGDKPVTFRTLDIGGDKALPYFGEIAGEENPAMGYRAMRLSLDRPQILRVQLRAMIRAAAGRPLRVMFPMVATVAEFERGRAVLARAMSALSRRGEPVPAALQVGTMLEVPALLFQLERLLAHVDFLSIGSNDLMQFLYASDRGNPRLDGRYDALSPSGLTALRRIAEAGVTGGKPVSLCGELAGDPVGAMALIGLGITRLSMAPASIGPVRVMLRSLSVDRLRPFLDDLMLSGEASIRARLIDFARDHGVELG